MHSSRCVQSQLFGSERLDGAQAEYVRVPLAETTLFKAPLDLSDDALILMSDIFPTGFYGVQNAFAGLRPQECAASVAVIIGCGPVGMCAIVAALEYDVKHLFAIDMVESRLKIAENLGAIPLNLQDGETSMLNAIAAVTQGRGADVVVEVVGQEPALRLAYDIVRPFGCISSIGAHFSSMPFSAAEGYDKNVTLRMGRCPVRSIFAQALDVLLKKQHVFRFMFEHKMSLIDAPKAYELFDKNQVQKIIFET
ncbi:GroES-like protein [Hortaea werneckii]|nr:GroES-like protein [Hortaea werneckii]KAI7323945.1 GroES-like protein [Hortaea werneckii]